MHGLTCQPPCGIIDNLSHGGGEMEWMTRADVLLLVIATYIAVMTLVRMMQRRRDQLVADVRRQVDVRRKQARRAQNDRTRDAA
jgi:hypothetical protein